jgi:4-methylaminobutanoate oxidase (formaldehyde-forming)
VDVQEITPAQVQELMPSCKVDDIEAGFYVPTDGRVNPYDACQALAKGARMGGATIREGVEVSGVTKDALGKRVTGVTLKDGTVIKAGAVVNCAGMWARQFGEICGVNVPNQAAEHYYLITEGMSEVDKEWPVVEDPEAHVYIRPEGDGLMLGLFEPWGAAWNVARIPSNFGFGEITPDWDRMMPYLETAMNRVPSTLDVGAKKFFCGPESFTPDNGPIVGEAPELSGYFVGAGMNSVGILSGGGIGKLLAEWVHHGHPGTWDVTGMNISRFHKYQSNPEYRRDRVCESLGLTYKIHYPSKDHETCRNVKMSPINARLQNARAYFGNVSGWEAPLWYAPPGIEPRIAEYSFGRENWFPYWEAEHKACRESCALIDMSFMSKFLVQGRDAGRFLNRLSTANVDGDCDTITYTQWLNEEGKMQGDLTVVKMAHDKFMVIATDTMLRHTEMHMNRRIGGRLFSSARF